jgi:phosphoribosylamine--glycine ligase
MRILIIGGGGREHALAWKVAQSPKVEAVWVAPGNAGTALEAKVHNLNLAVTAITELKQCALDLNIDLCIVGPEAALAAGIVDVFTAAKIPCLGPTQAAAKLESSKAYAKAFMQQHKIPTAAFASFDKAESALNYLKQQKFPIVLKADGLAQGKGVIIAQNYQEAATTIEDFMVAHTFGLAGNTVVIEEFLSGEELSFIALVDGKHILPLASSQDHKRRDDGDRGPNTGGMGAYSPAPVLDSALTEIIMETILWPTVRGLAAEGINYRGFLYAGLMIDDQGQPHVLEFNCRLGDPETQPLLMRLQSDLIDLAQATVSGRLDQVRIQWDPRPALGVVMCTAHYPEAYPTGEIINGIAAADQMADCKVFHAGTELVANQVVSQGGRVLCVTALGYTVADAQRRAYQACQKISWPKCFYRLDIGYRAIGRTA